MVTHIKDLHDSPLLLIQSLINVNLTQSNSKNGIYEEVYSHIYFISSCTETIEAVYLNPKSIILLSYIITSLNLLVVFVACHGIQKQSWKANASPITPESPLSKWILLSKIIRALASKIAIPLRSRKSFIYKEVINFIEMLIEQ